MSTDARIGVVIVAWNGWEYTRSCLASLRASRGNHQVVVVDNGSTDGTPDRIRESFPEVELLETSANLGFTGGNNVGIRWCLERGFDAVLILNNDAVVHTDTLEKMLEVSSDKVIVAPRVMRRDGVSPGAFAGGFDWTRGTLLPLDPATLGGEPREVDLASGCCLLIPRNLFESIGLFDEDFFLYYEELDLLVRAAAVGYRVILQPQAVVVHDESSSSGGKQTSPVRLYYSTRNRLHFMRKHRTPDHVRFLIYFLAGRVVQGVVQVLRGRWRLALLAVLATLDAFRGKMGKSPRVTG